jgi:ribosome biogenesis GTPase A
MSGAYAEQIASKFKIERINWFPGHMYRAMRLIKEFSSSVDVFLEIRDARVPISSKNDEFDALITEHNKKKFIIFNKFDLCNKRITQKLID